MALSDETREIMLRRRMARLAEHDRVVLELNGDPFAGLVDQPTDDRPGATVPDPQPGHDRLSRL